MSKTRIKLKQFTVERKNIDGMLKIVESIVSTSGMPAGDFVADARNTTATWEQPLFSCDLRKNLISS